MCTAAVSAAHAPGCWERSSGGLRGAHLPGALASSAHQQRWRLRRGRAVPPRAQPPAGTFRAVGPAGQRWGGEGTEPKPRWGEGTPPRAAHQQPPTSFSGSQRRAFRLPPRAWVALGAWCSPRAAALAALVPCPAAPSSCHLCRAIAHAIALAEALLSGPRSERATTLHRLCL